jgi:hypothetical protein
LPPVPEWKHYPQRTVFGLASYRQMDATAGLIMSFINAITSNLQKPIGTTEQNS